MRLLPLLLLLHVILLGAPLHADDTDLITPARAALAQGQGNALQLAADALKAKPAAADANLNMSLAMFHAGHFEDSARYLRRAIAADSSVLEDVKPLTELMPAADVAPRLNEVAPLAAESADLCFLTGAMLLLNRDRARGLAFLVRAEELAGTDGQAAVLMDADAEDRNMQRALVALKAGEWDDAARAFAFAALDRPGRAEIYLGLAIALAADGDDATALSLAGVAFSSYSPRRLLPWLQGLETAEGLVAAAARLEKGLNAGLGHYRLASVLYFVARHYRSAREAGVQALMVKRLDDFSHDLQGWLEQNNLRHDPAGSERPDRPQPEPEPEPQPAAPDLNDAREMIRRGAFAEAGAVLDALTVEGAPADVYFLQFVVLVARNKVDDGATAFQVWFQKADDSARTKLNALRSLFARAELFDTWRAVITRARDADPNAGLPRMLMCYVELTRGRYTAAREEAVVARIALPGNAAVQGLERILKRDEFQTDMSPGGIPDDPEPRVLVTRADRLFNEGDYAGARTLYLRALEADRNLPFISLSVMRVYFALGDYDAAYRQLEVMFIEQDMKTRQAQDFRLFLDVGYNSAATFDAHVAALKAECDKRPLSTTPWVLYGIIQLTRGGHDTEARDALKVWYDNARGERSAIILKFYDLAKRRAS